MRQKQSSAYFSYWKTYKLHSILLVSPFFEVCELAYFQENLIAKLLVYH
jgi:hypothetical protein